MNFFRRCSNYWDASRIKSARFTLHNHDSLLTCEFWFAYYQRKYLNHSKEKRDLRRKRGEFGSGPLTPDEEFRFSEGSDSQGTWGKNKVKTIEMDLENVLPENMIETHLQKKTRIIWRNLKSELSNLWKERFLFCMFLIKICSLICLSKENFYREDPEDSTRCISSLGVEL